MYCVKCGSLMEPGANFCTVCGERAFEGEPGSSGFLDEYASDGPIDDDYERSERASIPKGRRGGFGKSNKALIIVAIAVVAIALIGSMGDLVENGSDTDVERSSTVGDFTFYGGMVSDDITASGTSSGTMVYTGSASDVYWRYKVLSDTYLVKTSYGYYDERGYETVSGSSLTFSEPGNYSVQLYVDGNLGSSGRAVLDGTVTSTYTWSQSVDGRTYTYSASFTYDFSDYYKYASDSSAVRRSSYVLDDSRFAVVDDAILDLEDSLSAAYLKARGSSASLTGHEYADYLLSFVQCAIAYPDMVVKKGSHWYEDRTDGVGDIFLNGQEEYWSYPMETLYLGYGDCEDTSFLACALFSAAGYKSATVTLTSHMMAAVSLDSIASDTFYGAYASGYGTLKSTGEKMYYCETTYETAVPAGYYSKSVQSELSTLKTMSVVQPYSRET